MGWPSWRLALDHLLYSLQALYKYGGHMHYYSTREQPPRNWRPVARYTSTLADTDNPASPFVAIYAYQHTGRYNAQGHWYWNQWRDWYCCDKCLKAIPRILPRALLFLYYRILFRSTGSHCLCA